MQTVRLVGCAFLSLFIVTTCRATLPAENSSLVNDESTATEATPSPAPSPKPASEGHFSIGVGVKVSTLGIGGEVAIPVAHRLNARFGFNAFNYSHTFDKDGVTYKSASPFRFYPVVSVGVGYKF
jgi:hypothetical protein